MNQNGLPYDHGARYLVQPVRWGMCESREKKTPQFYITAKVLGQIDPNDPNGDLIAAPDGEMTAFWFFTENAIDNMIRDLADIGYNLPHFDGLVQGSQNGFDFAAKPITYTCKHEQYNGKWRARYEYGTGGSFNPLPLDLREVAKLNAQFGARARKLAQGGNGQPAGRERQTITRNDVGTVPTGVINRGTIPMRQPVAPAPTQPDNDIPF